MQPRGDVNGLLQPVYLLPPIINTIGYAQSFASLFKIIVIGSLEEFSNDGRIAPDNLIGTIPADKTTLDTFPQSLFARPEGVCVDMSYNPRYTLLPAATDKYGEGRWGTASGIDVLLEQAFTQVWMFTGKKAPREVMWEAVRKADAEKGSFEKFSMQGCVNPGRKQPMHVNAELETRRPCQICNFRHNLNVEEFKEK
jgi:hypothetical protein